MQLSVTLKVTALLLTDEEVYGALHGGGACQSRQPRRQEVDRNYRKLGSYLARHNFVEDTHTLSVYIFSRKDLFFISTTGDNPAWMSSLSICKEQPTKHFEACGQCGLEDDPPSYKKIVINLTASKLLKCFQQ